MVACRLGDCTLWNHFRIVCSPWCIGPYKEAIEDLRALNAPEDVIADLEKAQQSEDFEVSEENWPAVEMFLRLQTQWRVSFGGLVGLDYVAVKWLFDVYAVDDHKEMLDALMIMERAALSALSEDADGI